MTRPTPAPEPVRVTLLLPHEVADALHRLAENGPRGPLGMRRTLSEVARDLIVSELRRRGVLPPSSVRA